MPKQLALDAVRYHTGRGGPRRGAGRPPRARPKVSHRARQPIPAGCPIHVTLRLRAGLPSLRTGKFLSAFREVLASSVRLGFRVVHYSVQRDHVHLLVEARSKRCLERGMKSLGARIARAANRVFGRKGSVLDGRYHHRALCTPLEVRRALAYVLLNTNHHGGANRRIDTASSGVWFTGWRDGKPRPPARTQEVADARTWLLSVGWRRHGLIALDEVPGPRLSHRPRSRRRGEGDDRRKTL